MNFLPFDDTSYLKFLMLTEREVVDYFWRCSVLNAYYSHVRIGELLLDNQRSVAAYRTLPNVIMEDNKVYVLTAYNQIKKTVDIKIPGAVGKAFNISLKYLRNHNLHTDGDLTFGVRTSEWRWKPVPRKG